MVIDPRENRDYRNHRSRIKINPQHHLSSNIGVVVIALRTATKPNNINEVNAGWWDAHCETESDCAYTNTAISAAAKIVRYPVSFFLFFFTTYSPVNTGY